MIIRDKIIEKKIKEYFAEVDVALEIKRSDFNILLKGIRKKKERLDISNRMKIIREKGIISGINVIDDEGNVFTVSKIRPDGYLSLKGRRGGFSAVYLNVV